MKGFVYVLTNECMPGLVKIGRTSRCVEGRATELYQTGVPLPFKVVHSVLSPDCVDLECMVHERMPDVRVSESREFFRIDEDTALRVINDCHNEQISEWIDEFLPDHMVVPADLALDEGDMCFHASRLGVHFMEIVGAIHMATAEELEPIVDLYFEKVKERKRIREIKMQSREEGEALH